MNERMLFLCFGNIHFLLVGLFRQPEYCKNTSNINIDPWQPWMVCVALGTLYGAKNSQSTTWDHWGSWEILCCSGSCRCRSWWSRGWPEAPCGAKWSKIIRGWSRDQMHSDRRRLDIGSLMYGYRCHRWNINKWRERLTHDYDWCWVDKRVDCLGVDKRSCTWCQ